MCIIYLYISASSRNDFLPCCSIPSDSISSIFIFCTQIDALKCYAAVSSWLSITWQPKGVLRNDCLVPAVTVSQWSHSLISLRNRPHISHPVFSIKFCSTDCTALFLYWIDQWWGETFQRPFALTVFLWKYFDIKQYKTQDIKPIMHAALVFILKWRYLFCYVN